MKEKLAKGEVSEAQEGDLSLEGEHSGPRNCSAFARAKATCNEYHGGIKNHHIVPWPF